MASSVSCNIWIDEITEAASVFQQFRSRAGELPRRLRDEVEALASAPPDDMVEVQDTPDGAEVVLTPRVRALLGNLRARL